MKKAEKENFIVKGCLVAAKVGCSKRHLELHMMPQVAIWCKLWLIC